MTKNITDVKEILIVTGLFDQHGGEEYPIGDVIINKFKYLFNTTEIDSFNGGSIETLDKIFKNIKSYKIIVWMPNIPKGINKYLPYIKAINKTVLLIQLKNNDYNKYTMFQVIEGMFKTHSNLCLMISKLDNKCYYKLFDPLGNSWYTGTYIDEAAQKIASLTKYLQSLTRLPSFKSTVYTNEPILIKQDFINAVRSYGWIFSTLINTMVNKERFLGNASTRCMLGFPSIKKDDTFFISRRNINKELIDSEQFVPVVLEKDFIRYSGMHKPSVDAPTQLKLYNYYYNVNYIIHGHTYVTGAPITDKYIPCGCLEEVAEITKVVKDHSAYNFAINLIGHGCIILAKEVSYFAGIGMHARPFPENLSNLNGID